MKNVFLKCVISVVLLLGLGIQTIKSAQEDISGSDSPGLLRQFWTGTKSLAVPMASGWAGNVLGSGAIGYGRQALGISGENLGAGTGAAEPGFVQKWFGTGLTERIGGRTSSALAQRAARGWLAGSASRDRISDVVAQSIGSELGSSVGSRLGSEGIRAAQTYFGDAEKPWMLRLGEDISIPAETIASNVGSLVGGQLGGIGVRSSLSGAGERVGSWLLGKTPDIVQRWAREYPNLAAGIAVTTTLLAACAAATTMQGKLNVAQTSETCPSADKKKELLNEVLAENAAERGLTPEQAAREFYAELVEKSRLSLENTLSQDGLSLLDLEALKRLRDVWLDVYAAYLSDGENVAIDFALMYELGRKGIELDDIRKSDWDLVAQEILLLRKEFEASSASKEQFIPESVQKVSREAIDPAITRMQQENVRLMQEIMRLQDEIRTLPVPKITRLDNAPNITEQSISEVVSSEPTIKPFVPVAESAKPNFLTNEELRRIYGRISSLAGREGIRKDTQLLARIRASAQARNRMAKNILIKLQLPM